MANNDDASRQPAKQRKAQANAPQHRRREMMSAHLSEDLMLEYDRRSIALRVGDQVEIMRGDFAGHEGEILEIDYDDQEIEVDGAVNRSADGSQVARPIHASNVRITELDLTDPRRRAKIERKGVTVEEPEPEPEPEPEEEAEEPEAEPAEQVEPAAGAKGPDVAEQPEPELEPEEPEAEPEAPEAEEEAEPDEDTEAPADEPEEAEEEPAEADEAEPVDDTDEDTTDEDTQQEGSA
jgi:large subunit ribosomal protein L24